MTETNDALINGYLVQIAHLKRKNQILSDVCSTICGLPDVPVEVISAVILARHAILGLLAQEAQGDPQTLIPPSVLSHMQEVGPRALAAFPVDPRGIP